MSSFMVRHYMRDAFWHSVHSFSHGWSYRYWWVILRWFYGVSFELFHYLLLEYDWKYLANLTSLTILFFTDFPSNSINSCCILCDKYVSDLGFKAAFSRCNRIIFSEVPQKCEEIFFQSFDSKMSRHPSHIIEWPERDNVCISNIFDSVCLTLDRLKTV